MRKLKQQKRINKHMSNVQTSNIIFLTSNTAITLIALIVTIIVLLILAGVTLNMVMGDSGIFSKANTANEETNKSQATERMNLKITTAQMNSYAEKQTLLSLQELANILDSDNEIEYVHTSKGEYGSIADIDIGAATSIYTKLKEYPYEFEINSSLQLASIDGVKIATAEEESIPDGYIKPSGTYSISSNGEYNISQYEKVNVNVTTDKKYTEEEYQEYGNEKYNEGINANANSVANTKGYACGIVTLDEVGKISVDCGFKPKYLMITLETADGGAPSNIIFFYNEIVSTTNSYRYHKNNNVLYNETMEGNGSITNTSPHIYDVNGSGFGFYSTVNNGMKIYWTAFK